MLKIILLLAGGAAGTLARYGVSGLAHRYFTGTFPYGTLAVNLLGSLIIGFLWGAMENSSAPSLLRTFLFIGILGGFTTFSSYSLETLNLFRDGEFKMAAINILANNILGIILVFAGFFSSKAFLNLIH